MALRTAAVVLAAALLAACGSDDEASGEARAAFASSYQALPSKSTLIENATILTGTGERIDGGSILLRDGKIDKIGQHLRAKADVTIDAEGRWVTPGLIDAHSHLGVYASPGVGPTADGNEIAGPNTAQVWAEHAVWPQDPGFDTALAGGVTSMLILPGSANLFGGRGTTFKNVPATTYQAMKFPGAPHALKMACGENPKRVYGSQGGPYSRMGNMAGYREAWIKANDYLKKLEAAEGEDGGEPPTRDLQLETLAGVLKGEILVHNHCYRADEMANMLDLASEFGYKVTAFHHGVEAYKIADLLAENNVCGALWADWWGFKLEAYDSVRENIAIVDAPEGGCAIVHSDSQYDIQRLNQEAAKAMASGQRAGFDITPEHAIKWVTANPAKSMGILEQTGTLEIGKMADVVIWSGDPFSVYTLADQVFIDGALLYDRMNPERQPKRDFAVGIVEVSQ